MFCPDYGCNTHTVPQAPAAVTSPLRRTMAWNGKPEQTLFSSSCLLSAVLLHQQEEEKKKKTKTHRKHDLERERLDRRAYAFRHWRIEMSHVRYIQGPEDERPPRAPHGGDGTKGREVCVFLGGKWRKHHRGASCRPWAHCTKRASPLIGTLHKASFLGPPLPSFCGCLCVTRVEKSRRHRPWPPKPSVCYLNLHRKCLPAACVEKGMNEL